MIHKGIQLHNIAELLCGDGTTVIPPAHLPRLLERKVAVERLNLPRVVYVNGRSLLPSMQGLTTDLVHPSPFGMEEIARHLSTMMKQTMGLTQEDASPSQKTSSNSHYDHSPDADDTEVVPPSTKTPLFFTFGDTMQGHDQPL